MTRYGVYLDLKTFIQEYFSQGNWHSRKRRRRQNSVDQIEDFKLCEGEKKVNVVTCFLRVLFFVDVAMVVLDDVDV